MEGWGGGEAQGVADPKKGAKYVGAGSIHTLLQKVTKTYFLHKKLPPSGIRFELQSPRWQAETIPLDHAARQKLDPTRRV
jgi:hypothetical protein